MHLDLLIQFFTKVKFDKLLLLLLSKAVCIDYYYYCEVQVQTIFRLSAWVKAEQMQQEIKSKQSFGHSVLNSIVTPTTRSKYQ